LSYKIAVGSSDGTNVDLKFGEVKKFIIFEVEEGKRKLSEIRDVDDYALVVDSDGSSIHAGDNGLSGSSLSNSSLSNNSLSGCGSSGCGGNGHGCGESADAIAKVESIRDCRCVVCKKIGFHAQKQLERNGISAFDIEGTVDEILGKITDYYARIDQRR